MQTYCVSCKRNTGIKEARVIKFKNGRLQMKSHCSVCGKRKSQFMSSQKASVQYVGIKNIDLFHKDLVKSIKVIKHGKE